MGPSRYEPVERIKFLLESIDYSISFVLGIISKKYICNKNFIKSLVEEYGRNIVYINGVTSNDEACNVFRLKHYLHYI
jgi:hypothetical protein